MSWYKRIREGILTSTEEKIEVPDGLWTGCPSCKKPSHAKELARHKYVCPFCGYHFKIGSKQYFSILFDDEKYTEWDANLRPGNPLTFTDTKSYEFRTREAEKKTGLKEAARTAVGAMGGIRVAIGCMDFEFIGGSMGSVVGEKVSRAIDRCMAERLPFIMISKTGGARMMEGTLSLMQMAKTSAKLALLARERLPYISVLTDPTTGGVSASYGMLGDYNIAEPKALIGFAGPRVVRETIGKDLPPGFQSAEFLLEHGFVDLIVSRENLKSKLVALLQMTL
jgi:acetyl-CoA carboxylase carboxyl transferase subunit beta